MKKHLNKILVAALLFSTGMVGCKKELDINRNPNAVTESNITAELILPSALQGVASQSVGNLTATGTYGTGYGFLANWMGYWSPSGSYNPSTEESTYNITSTFNETRWSGIYNVLFDLDRVEQKALAAGASQDFYRSIAIILKAHLFQNLVDMYGNVPYSQAFKFLEFPTPAYDKAEDIYADLHVRLDTAVNLLKAAEITENAEEVDIVYHGDTDLWTRLANTLKLRLLIRTSEVNPNPAAELAKITENGGVLFSGEGAEANPGYVNDAGKQNPYFSAYGLTPSGGTANEYYRANAYMVQKLSSNNDPRLELFFATPSRGGSVTGTVYGAPPDPAFAGDLTSNIGPGIAKSADQSQWIVTSVESMFLYAEAVARGWFADDAQTAYEAAVTESFLWLYDYPADDADVLAEAESYLADSDIAKWGNAGSSMMDQVKFIVHQKYIALTGINPLEAWNDYRRLGVPADVPLSINPARGSRTIPVRLLYPSQEIAVNSANVQAQGNITPQTRIFWDKD